MSTLQSPREVGVGWMAHPDPMRTPYGVELELIRDPALLPLWAGDGLLGWQGDPKLALYVNKTYLRWELWRLEDNGEYSCTTTWSQADVRGGEIVGRCILYCLESDRIHRPRGFDLHDHVVEQNAKVHAKRMEPVQDQLNEAADRFAWGIRKDVK